MNLNMKNSYLLCDDSENNLDESSSGFIVKNLANFKTVTVIQSSEEDVPVGSRVRVHINAGEADDLGLIIKRGEIIYVE